MMRNELPQLTYAEAEIPNASEQSCVSETQTFALSEELQRFLQRDSSESVGYAGAESRSDVISVQWVPESLSTAFNASREPKALYRLENPIKTGFLRRCQFSDRHRDWF
jgi:hypothetical protein